MTAGAKIRRVPGGVCNEPFPCCTCRYAGKIPASWNSSEQGAWPRHVLRRDWLPLNDLLGHENTRLLISHCGASSQFEVRVHNDVSNGIRHKRLQNLKRFHFATSISYHNNNHNIRLIIKTNRSTTTRHIDTSVTQDSYLGLGCHAGQPMMIDQRWAAAGSGPGQPS